LIYAALTVWLFLTLLIGVGTYRLWTSILRPSWVNWVLFPGTVVSEMAYIFGSLITGGEIRRARLMDKPESGRARKAGADAPGAEATAGLKFFGPVLAAALAIAACAAAILIVEAVLGDPVIGKFTQEPGSPLVTGLAQELPRTWGGFWDQLRGQLYLLQRMCETWAGLDWLDWRVPLFVYLSACLSVRLAPTTRPVRPTLAAAVLLAAVIAGIGAISGGLRHLINDIWPLLTYIYATLLFLLAVSGLVKGLVALAKALTERKRS